MSAGRGAPETVQPRLFTQDAFGRIATEGPGLAAARRAKLEDAVPRGKVATSREAFEATDRGGQRKTDQRRVYEYIARQGRRGATCDQICAALDMLVATGSARCNDLWRAGLIEPNGQKRNTRNGRPAKVYVVVMPWPERPAAEGEVT